MRSNIIKNIFVFCNKHNFIYYIFIHVNIHVYIYTFIRIGIHISTNAVSLIHLNSRDEGADEGANVTNVTKV